MMSRAPQQQNHRAIAAVITDMAGTSRNYAGKITAGTLTEHF